MSFTSRIAAAAARGYGMFRLAAGAVVDPFFNYVTALLHGDGTNGAQNNTFLDSSTNNFTITRNGNTTQGTFSPFSQTGWSNYFDGNGDGISFGSNVNTNPASSDITVEAWIFPLAYNSYGPIFSNDINGGFHFGKIASGFGVRQYGTGDVVFTANTPALNQWTHVAVSRSGSSWYLFFNGIQVATATASNTFTQGTACVGGNASTATEAWNGYLSNVRFVKGTALYTSNFTPSTTPLTAVTNTQLLTCQDNRYKDNSSNAYAVTVFGTPSVQAFSPFNPTSAWSASSNGGSGYFDGSGDYLSIAYNSALDLGGSDFTVEGWVYSTNNGSALLNVIDFGWQFGVYGPLFVANTSGTLLFYASSNGSSWDIANGTTIGVLPLNSWNHFAISRNGTSIRVFFNGALVTTITTSAALMSNASRAITIGGDTTGAYNFGGYISGLRVVKGSSVYNAAFSVPTAPPTAVTNTQLLTNFTNAGIYDNAAVGNYETVGNAQVSTSVVKYGTGSMAFDGTGDWLTAPAQQAFSFGSGDWTVEFWLYTAQTTEALLVANRSGTGATNTNWYIFKAATTNQITLYVSDGSAWQINNLTGGPSVSNSTWNHIAVCRIGSTFKIYVNGTQAATGTWSGAISATLRPLMVGSDYAGATTLNGYIDDLRITKGIARYPYNFTPPTAAFPNIGGTVTPTSDQYFRYTTLLLPGNGTNGAQNNTFLDSSSNAFTITRNGNTTQGNFSPFSQTGWGNYFDGTNSKVTMASAASMSMTGQFTIECWVYWTGTTTLYQNFIGSNDTFTSNASFFRVWGSGMVGAGSVGIGNPTHDSTSSVYAANALPINQWTHVAATRDSSNIIRVFINGTLRATGSADTSTYDFGQGGTCIGDSPWDGANGWYSGYISNLRVVKGGALYTSSFTPSTTPLTTTVSAGTVSLLTCQSNRFLDNSSNAYALTPAGNASVQAFSPFAPTASYSASTNGGSGYFDGSGDYLLGPANSTPLSFGTGDFTIETWVYPLNFTNTNGTMFAAYGATTGAYILWLQSGYPNFYVYNSGGLNGNIFTSGTILNLNAWNHVAVTRASGVFRLFLNGALINSINNSTANINATTSNNSSVGAYFQAGMSLEPTSVIAGYLADVRVVKGTAVYTAAFTPPTAPLTAISGTSLLLSATNGAITDATAKNDLETVGNAQISTTQSKFGGSSMYFDGTGDWLYSPSSNLYSIGSGDFTVEYWLYLTANFTAAGSGMVTAAYDTNWNVLGYNSGSGNIVRFYVVNSFIDASTAITLNTWTHVAITRYNNTARIFINGIQSGSGTLSGTGGNSALYVGTNSHNTAQTMTGYIDDLRITKGIARYTSNFTPPTSAFLTL